ncbi:zinc-binding dehydrogenase [Synoicihabitans lomoniglobus]|uniref:Zinc-binding dehydrogenase n=1 Tax=Synoicihabitans lomoniglobus TaxID=2909285 RepID=A0AAF0I3D9_9BACT|nr:zinc-binding dehydrogenase [Opitutaceae bacterium LMO-M01]WED66074.1 zinc-binding dehydrogenase [Opitutaceae bacterium LMO-M01]
MSETMQALVNYGPEPGSVELREVAVPSIGEEDVLLAVKAVGICGSDLHQFSGHQSWPVNYPVILGHEFAGVVVRVGKRVKNYAEGDRVVSETAAVIDESSPLSRQGLYNLDPHRLGFGYGVDGAMAKYVRVPARCLHRLPEGLRFETAALTEPCCVAYNATCVHARLRPGDSVAVIGPGPIGLLCAMMARLAGAGHVAVIGIPADTQRLTVARSLGMDTTLGAEGDDPMAWAREFGDGHGVDIVIDAAGVSATLKMAMALVRPAGQIVKVGWGPQPLDFSLDPLVQKAVTLQGSFSHNWPIWEKVLTLLGSGRLNLDLVLNRVAPLADWRPSFEAMRSGEIVKGVLNP